jgi:DNA-binding transcriptional MerR regulator
MILLFVSCAGLVVAQKGSPSERLNASQVLDAWISTKGTWQRTRLGLALDAVAHSCDHYGQMVEYLRMSGIVPPEAAKPCGRWCDPRSSDVNSKNIVVMPALLTIGEVARKAGLRASAIRFYEKIGLLPKPIRSSGQRRYDPSILGRLAVLQRARDCGFTLEEARGFFNDCGRPSERWQRVARKKIAELDALIDRVAAIREMLLRRCECADLDECGRKMVEAKGRRFSQ